MNSTLLHSPYQALSPPPFDLAWGVQLTSKCKSKRKGDGIWDGYNSRWDEYPCSNMQCPRHWRRYGSRRYRQLKNKLGKKKFTYHIRLSCKRYIKQGERFQCLTKFLAKLKAYIPDANIFWVVHRNKSGDHFHLGLMTNVNDVDGVRTKVRKFWQAHFPAKQIIPWDNGNVYVKEWTNPRKLLYYAIFGTKKKPRVRAPWTANPLRSPIKLVRGS